MAFVPAMHWAGDHPDRIAGVIGIAPVATLMDKGRLGDRIYSERGGKEELERSGEMTNVYTRPPNQLVYSGQFVKEYLSFSLLHPDNQAMLTNMKSRVYFVASDKDSFSPVADIEAIARQLEFSSIEICKGANHLMDGANALETIRTTARTAIEKATSHQCIPRELVSTTFGSVPQLQPVMT